MEQVDAAVPLVAWEINCRGREPATKEKDAQKLKERHSATNLGNLAEDP